MNTKKNILVCPLEWGLGHAGRMVPLARRLKELDQNLFFGAGEEILSFFRKEVPGATYIFFPGFSIRYSRFFPQFLVILLNTPVLICHSISEHRKLKKIIQDHSIDIVISDNRIGLWNNGIKSVFITHQLRIKFPRPFRFLEFIGIQAVRQIINKYSFCFIPDLDGDINLSGELSHGMKIPGNVRYIGILSRFTGMVPASYSGSGKFLVILSGPEPQRSILKQQLTELFDTHGFPAVFLEGKPDGSPEKYIRGSLEFLNHPDQETTARLILESKKIICRAGYTTIMELASLGRSALLVPTYGQTEQEYLAEYLSGKGWFRSISQKELGEKSLWEPASYKIPEIINEKSRILFSSALEELLKN